MLPLTFLIAWHLEISEWPIILSGEQILMKGNCESSEILAARAVFPLWGGPERQKTLCVRTEKQPKSAWNPEIILPNKIGYFH